MGKITEWLAMPFHIIWILTIIVLIFTETTINDVDWFKFIVIFGIGIILTFMPKKE